MVVKKNGLYQNTSVTQTFLVEDSPTFLGHLLAFTEKQWFYASLKDLPKLVKEGHPTPSPEANMGTEEMWAQVVKSIANNQRAGRAQQAVEIVSKLPEFPSFRKMLDLGGSAGVHGIAIVASHPSMKGVIFDRPAIVKVAKTFIKEYEMEGRIDVLGGDFIRDPIGEEYDLMWACAALNYVRDDLDTFMKKIYDALNPDGVLISFQEGMIHERTKPEVHVLGNLSTALMGQDHGFDQGEIADSMLRVGFKSVRSRALDTPMGPMDLDIGRKA